MNERRQMPHGTRHRLEPDIVHELPEQTHEHTRGHQVHLDITEHTDPAVLVKVDCEVSTDGGKTWTYGGGFTREGGPAVDGHGEPAKYTVVAFGHEPDPRHKAAVQRLVRTSVTVTGGTLQTSLHVCGLAHAHLDLSAIPKD